MAAEPEPTLPEPEKPKKKAKAKHKPKPEPVKPAGPMLEKPTPAQLTGPTVIRVEKAEPEGPRRGKRPRPPRGRFDKPISEPLMQTAPETGAAGTQKSKR